MGRQKAEYVVLESVEGESGLLPVANIAGKAAGLKWIKANGKPGAVYRVGTLLTPPLRVSVMEVERRTVCPAETLEEVPEQK